MSNSNNCCRFVIMTNPSAQIRSFNYNSILNLTAIFHIWAGEDPFLTLPLSKIPQSRCSISNVTEPYLVCAPGATPADCLRD